MGVWWRACYLPVMIQMPQSCPRSDGCWLRHDSDCCTDAVNTSGTDTVGASVGDRVGLRVGALDGGLVGALVGLTGRLVGARVGEGVTAVHRQQYEYCELSEHSPVEMEGVLEQVPALGGVATPEQSTEASAMVVLSSIDWQKSAHVLAESSCT